jgi:hypothetical protein
MNVRIILPADEQSEVDQATPPRKVWAAEDIKALLAKSDKAVGRALLALLARQTYSEQQSHSTKDANGRGFNAFDADIFTSMAEFYRSKGFLTEKQLAFLRSGTAKRPAPRINKYAAQLAAIANGDL